MKSTIDKYLNDTNTHKAYLYTLVTQPSKIRKKRQSNDSSRYTTVSYISMRDTGHAYVME